MVRITDEEFEAMVGEVFDSLPDDMVAPLENVALLIADQPPGARPRLYGLYSGRPLTTRGVYGFGELPDRITLYRQAILAICETEADVDDRLGQVDEPLAQAGPRPPAPFGVGDGQHEAPGGVPEEANRDRHDHHPAPRAVEQRQGGAGRPRGSADGVGEGGEHRQPAHQDVGDALGGEHVDRLRRRAAASHRASAARLAG